MRNLQQYARSDANNNVYAAVTLETTGADEVESMPGVCDWIRLGSVSDAKGIPRSFRPPLGFDSDGAEAVIVFDVVLDAVLEGKWIDAPEAGRAAKVSLTGWAATGWVSTI
jgi:hypothetical protein